MQSRVYHLPTVLCCQSDLSFKIAVTGDLRSLTRSDGLFASNFVLSCTVGRDRIVRIYAHTRHAIKQSGRPFMIDTGWIRILFAI